VTSSDTASAFAGFRLPPQVISVAVRWYLRYGLSYRDVEELLAERGVTVDHVTVYRWVQRFTPEFVSGARPRRHVPGDRWFVDETYVKVAGVDLFVPGDRPAWAGVLLRCAIARWGEGLFGRRRRLSEGKDQLIEGGGQTVSCGQIRGDVVVAAAQVLHEKA
jgi:hypothetical protein